MFCLGSPAPEPSTVKGVSQDCMCLGMGAQAALFRGKHQGAAEGQLPWKVQEFERCSLSTLSGCRAAAEAGTCVS